MAEHNYVDMLLSLYILIKLFFCVNKFEPSHYNGGNFSFIFGQLIFQTLMHSRSSYLNVSSSFKLMCANREFCLIAYWVIFHAFLSSADFFQN